MSVTFELNDFGFGDGKWVEVQSLIIVTANIERPEIWDHNCNNKGYGLPYVEEVAFDCCLGINSPVADEALEKYFADKYNLDKDFREHIDELAIKAWEDEITGFYMSRRPSLIVGRR